MSATVALLPVRTAAQQLGWDQGAAQGVTRKELKEHYRQQAHQGQQYSEPFASQYSSTSSSSEAQTPYGYTPKPEPHHKETCSCVGYPGEDGKPGPAGTPGADGAAGASGWLTLAALS
jgi:hypothetical protein